MLALDSFLKIIKCDFSLFNQSQTEIDLVLSSSNEHLKTKYSLWRTWNTASNCTKNTESNRNNQIMKMACIAHHFNLLCMPLIFNTHFIQAFISIFQDIQILNHFWLVYMKMFPCASLQYKINVVNNIKKCWYSRYI